ncbi:MAG: hypothetical protein WCO89_11560 [Syntrophus sp. (in: bacteria)]
MLKEGGGGMARPITPTPALNAKEFEAFWEKVKEEEKKPLGLAPTPKINEAIEIMRQHERNATRSC